MAYTRVNWEDLPSTNTPINATNLNKMDLGIKDLNDYVNGLNTYSTTEQVIGTWTDGKPLYKKVVTATMPTFISSQGEGYDDVNIGTNIAIPMLERAYFVSGSRYFPLPYITSEGKAARMYFLDSNTIRVFTANADWNGLPLIFVVLYTKTTDSASRSVETISNEETPVEEETR